MAEIEGITKGSWEAHVCEKLASGGFPGVLKALTELAEQTAESLQEGRSAGDTGVMASDIRGWQSVATTLERLESKVRDLPGW